MKILILSGKATNLVSIGQISPLGATYCKGFAHKSVDRGLKIVFRLSGDIISYNSKYECSFQIYRGIAIRSNLRLAQN